MINKIKIPSNPLFQGAYFGLAALMALQPDDVHPSFLLTIQAGRPKW